MLKSVVNSSSPLCFTQPIPFYLFIYLFTYLFIYLYFLCFGSIVIVLGKFSVSHSTPSTPFRTPYK